jgi:hypothetical protein
MAEQLTLNQWVQGSSPWSVTRTAPYGGLFDFGFSAPTKQATWFKIMDKLIESASTHKVVNGKVTTITCL